MRVHPHLDEETALKEEEERDIKELHIPALRASALLILFIDSMSLRLRSSRSLLARSTILRFVQVVFLNARLEINIFYKVT